MKKLSLLFIAPFVGGCAGFEPTGMVQAIAKYYGYKTLGTFLRANFTLIVVLIAFIIVGLVFLRLLNRQFPKQGKEPGKTWIFRATIIFFICAFTFVCGFAMFVEKNKLAKEKAEQSGLYAPKAVFPTPAFAGAGSSEEKSLRFIRGRRQGKGFLTCVRNDRFLFNDGFV